MGQGTQHQAQGEAAGPSAGPPVPGCALGCSLWAQGASAGQTIHHMSVLGGEDSADIHSAQAGWEGLLAIEVWVAGQFCGHPGVVWVAGQLCGH